MSTKLIIAAIAGFIVSLAGGFIFHGMILHGDYAQIQSTMRPEADAQAHLPFLLLSHLIKGFGFAWIYSKGITPGVPWLTQGLKFGIATILLTTIPFYLVYYTVEPIPGMLMVKQIIFDSITMLAMGVVTAFVYKSASSN